MWIIFHQTTRLRSLAEVKRHFRPFAPPKTTDLSPPHHSSAQHAQKRGGIETRCLWISMLPQFISPWRSFRHISSWHLTTCTKTNEGTSDPSHLAHPKEHRAKKNSGKSWEKSPKKVEPAINKMYGFGMFWCLFFFSCCKTWSCFWIPRRFSQSLSSFYRLGSNTAKFVTSEGISVSFLRPLRSSDHHYILTPRKATYVHKKTSPTWTLDTAREHRAPAKDPAPSHPAYKHTQTYIQAYTQNKAEAILTNIHTSIYIKQTRSNTYKNTHKHTYKHTYKNKTGAPPKQHPKKQNSKKYITLYNSKYCIR